MSDVFSIGSQLPSFKIALVVKRNIMHCNGDQKDLSTSDNGRAMFGGNIGLITNNTGLLSIRTTLGPIMAVDCFDLHRGHYQSRLIHYSTPVTRVSHRWRGLNYSVMYTGWPQLIPSTVCSQSKMQMRNNFYIYIPLLLTTN